MVCSKNVCYSAFGCKTKLKLIFSILYEARISRLTLNTQAYNTEHQQQTTGWYHCWSTR